MLKIIVVSGPVIVEDGKVLLNQHGEDNFWKFCGGRVEDYNVDLAENARREAREEMGIDIEVINKNPFIIYLQKETAEGKVDVILAHFLAKRIGEVKPDSEIREWNWFSMDNLPGNIAPNVKPALKHFGF
ncbi:MAG: NUDIX domain-containing protein [Candidatus Doudnabacteria bacterium]